jgi:hypothetical protein
MANGAHGPGTAMLRQMRGQNRLIAKQQEARIRVAFGGQFQPIEHHAGRVVASHGVDRQGERFGHCQRCAMQTEVTRGVASGADGVLERLASRNHLAPVVVAAMAADVVRTLQLAAVAAFGMGFVRQRLMAAPHSPA